MDKKTPFEERVKLAREKLTILFNELDLELIPIISRTPSSDVATLQWIDLQNPAMMAQFGVVRIPKVNADKPIIEGADKDKMSN